MFIAMNRFRVVPGYEETFESIWRERKSHLSELPGYIEFQMLKGPKADDHTLYASHTVWATKDDFLAWTKSNSSAPPMPWREPRQGGVSLRPAFRRFRRHHP